MSKCQRSVHSTVVEKCTSVSVEHIVGRGGAALEKEEQSEEQIKHNFNKLVKGTMVSEAICGGEGPSAMHYGSAEKVAGCCSEEQMALTFFCQRLGASSNCTNEPPGIVDETRKEAKLLMSLMLSNVPSSKSEEEEASGLTDSLTSSSSDHSFNSDCSASTSTRRDIFTFTCPSLSLENPSLESSHLQCDRKSSVDTPSNKVNEESPPPALLLGRPLKVDDRDALRLSADAMARNVLQSFQKAMDWRIQAWIYSLSKDLVKQERTMIEAGAAMEDVKALIDTPEAALIVALRSIAEEHRISVEATNTSFEVLSHRAQADEDRNITKKAAVKRLSLGSNGEQEGSEQLSNDESAPPIIPSNRKDEFGYYSYTVVHQLRLSCDVQLKTPAGFGEITITVPGTVEGSFRSSELDPTAELKSVTVNLDTTILARMVEKACRTIVRSSVEKVMTQREEVDASEDEEAVEETETPATAREESFTLSSPPTYMNQHASAAVFVTPRNVQASDALMHTTTPSSMVIFPIPDDFDEKTDKPRQISPQPSSHDFISANSDVFAFAPRSMKRSSPSQDSGNAATTNVKKRLPLISPLASNDARQFHEVPENGPSLPILVEVACRAMRFD